MKKIILIIIGTVFSIFTSSAADTSSQAKKILDKATAGIDMKNGATANFSISGGKIGKQNGSIAIKGNKFNVRTSRAILWYNGKTQWLYNKNSNEVNVSLPNASQHQMMNPYYFLTIYKNGYTMSMETTASKDYNIHLVGKGKQISELYILVDKKYNIKQVKMKRGNEWITIVISNYKKQNLSDSSFSFNAKDYPKAEIIDLR